MPEKFEASNLATVSPSTQRETSRHSKRPVLIELGLYTLFFALAFRNCLFHDWFIDPLGIRETIPEVWPHAHYLSKSIVQGGAALWNPYTWLGTSFVGIPQVGFWYPANWLYQTLPFQLVLKWDILLHAYIMGVFLYLLGRRLFVSRIATFWIVFAFLGSWNVLLEGISKGNPGVLHTLCYVPLALLCLIQIQRGVSLSWCILFAVTIALQIFGGWIQIVLYQLLIFGLFMASFLMLSVLSRRMRLSTALWRGTAAFSGVALGLTLALVQLVPSFELLAVESVRAKGVAPAFIDPVPPLHMLRILLGVPTEFGLAGLKEITSSDWSTHFGQSIGVFTLALAAVALFNKPSRLLYCIVGSTVFAFLFGLGQVTPVYGWVAHLPPFGMDRLPLRIWILASFMLVIVAGFAIDELASSVERSTPFRFRIFLFCAFSFALYSYRLMRSDLGHPLIEFLVLIIAAGVFLAWSNKMSPRLLAAWLGVCIVFETMLTASFNIGPGGDETHYELNADYLAWSNQREDNDRVWLRVKVFSMRAPVFPIQFGLFTEDRMLNGKGPLPLARFVDVFARVLPEDDVKRGTTGRIEYLALGAIQQHSWVTQDTAFLVNLLNIRYVIVPGVLRANKNPEFIREQFVHVPFDGLTVLENPDVGPIAFIVHEAETFEDEDELLDRMFSPAFDYAKTALTTEPQDFTDLRPASRPEPVEVTKYESNQIELRVDMSAPGILVLTDMYYPGWSASIDGEEKAEVFPVYHMLRGLRVPEGKHVVRFEYWPTHFTFAIAGSVGAAVLCIVLGILGVARVVRGGSSIRASESR